jgi:hypothetical protein
VAILQPIALQQMGNGNVQLTEVKWQWLQTAFQFLDLKKVQVEMQLLSISFTSLKIANRLTLAIVERILARQACITTGMLCANIGSLNPVKLCKTMIGV